MSKRPTDQPNGDDLESAAATGSDADASAATGFEDDEPTIEEGDAALLAGAEEAPLATIAGLAEVEEAATQTRPMRPSERRAMRAAMEHSQIVIDPTHRVSDRPSAIFVLLAVGVFVLILLNGILLGHGGFLTPIPTPSPVPTVTALPVPSTTLTPSGSVAPNPTILATPVPTATPAVTAPPPSQTPAPS